MQVKLKKKLIYMFNKSFVHGKHHITIYRITFLLLGPYFNWLLIILNK